MWFVSRRRYDDLLLERNGLQDLLFRASTAIKKAEIDRDQAKAGAQHTAKQLEAAQQEVRKITGELEAALQEVSKIAGERNALLTNLRSIRDFVSALPTDPLVNGIAAAGVEHAAADAAG
jgi:uncharacterized protein (DUF3084 family)